MTPDRDLYGLLGVPREASRQDIVQAWRRRARAQHPDTHPRDAAASARFRALAEAYRVLGDPGRRAAYDRALGREFSPGTAGPADRPASSGPARAGTPVAVKFVRRPEPPLGEEPPLRAEPPLRPEPPLRAGPVWVGARYADQTAPVWVEDLGANQVAEMRTAHDQARLAVIAELATRYLSGRWGRPW
ncbi:MAG TPA: J domain-containing protein [Streptosporangiaceae bacterium]|nr:J domain-containing protein [Streptosporangiaceae bacterium]